MTKQAEYKAQKACDEAVAAARKACDEAVTPARKVYTGGKLNDGTN